MRRRPALTTKRTRDQRVILLQGIEFDTGVNLGLKPRLSRHKHRNRQKQQAPIVSFGGHAAVRSAEPLEGGCGLCLARREGALARASLSHDLR